MISSYGKVYVAGNKWVDNVFSQDVVVSEKIDGSQFSVRVTPEKDIHFRSRNVPMTEYSYERMFDKVIESIIEIKDYLNPNYIYRGEYVSSPKHHAVKYDRTPNRYFIVFDIELFNNPQVFLTPELVKEEVTRLELETVPIYFQGKVNSAKELLHLLDNKPILGGEHIEGIVIKNYSTAGSDGKILKAKLVRDDFKEVQSVEWKKQNPSSNDIVSNIITSLRTNIRWEKSIQHLSEAGVLNNIPQDISSLIKEIQSDIVSEEIDNIKNILYKHFERQILSGVIKGFPEYYKRKLNGLEDYTIE